MSEGNVTYKGSYTRPDGGWDHLEISLPVGIPEAVIEVAIAQWAKQRELGLAALLGRPVGSEASYTDPDPKDVRVTFGKYQGMTLAAVYEVEPSYLDWLATNARDVRMRQHATDFIKGVLAPALPQAVETGTKAAAKADDDIPF